MFCSERWRTSKFDAKAEEGILLGYSLESKAYRVYLISNKKVIVSLNVTFDDSKSSSLLRQEDSESLQFEDLSEDLSESEGEPEVVADNNENPLRSDSDRKSVV